MRKLISVAIIYPAQSFICDFIWLSKISVPILTKECNLRLETSIQYIKYLICDLQGMRVVSVKIMFYLTSILKHKISAQGVVHQSIQVAVPVLLSILFLLFPSLQACMTVLVSYKAGMLWCPYWVRILLNNMILKITYYAHRLNNPIFIKNRESIP